MLALTSVCALSSSAARVTMEEGVAAVPSRTWLAKERCAAATEISLMVMLKKSAEQARQLEEAFWAVSDPDSPRYGQHLNASAIAMFGASDAVIGSVTSWLVGEGASAANVAIAKDAIEVTMPCATAERVFATEITTFVAAASKRLRLHRATTAYSLPAAVAPHIAMVGDLVGLPALRTPIVTNGTTPSTVEEGSFPSSASCGGKCGATFVTPAVLKQAYSLGEPPSTSHGSIAVAEFQGVKYDTGDLSAFSKACGVDLKVTNVGSASSFTCAIPLLGTELCGEALLDIEYAGALAGSIPLTDIYNSGYSLLKWATAISNMASPPLVHSVSYGNDEAQQTSTAFMQQANTQFQKLGAMGISVLFASGDQGVLGREGRGDKYHPDFPAASPYITAVGGTDFATRSTIGAEKAWTQGGGGFSDTFDIPSYQSSAVQAYLSSASGLPPADKWNRSGRGYPDVAALGGQANPYCIRAGSMFAGVAGTSASSPVVAAVFAKLNELRLAKGSQPLGFLNPWIYKVAAQGGGFNDVKQGRNCGSAVCLGTAGFPAVSGWDAATGFGTPNFEKLATLI